MKQVSTNSYLWQFHGIDETVYLHWDIDSSA